jgi:hypothetical protein
MIDSLPFDRAATSKMAELIVHWPRTSLSTFSFTKHNEKARKHVQKGNGSLFPTMSAV